MTAFDIFNGDADGICALQQLRLQSPRDAVLITGMKREIDLLRRADVSVGDEVTVLDVSLDKNREALLDVLAAGARVFYADHHYPGEIPEHDQFECHIDVDANTCTSLIINAHLHGAEAKWAVVGAFGDNFDQAAIDLGKQIGLSDDELAALQQLGICLNYNGYGFEMEDLLYHPVELYSLVQPYQNPLDFIANESGYARLLEQYQSDMTASENAEAESISESAAIYLLPNQTWAKRIVGVMGNDLAKLNPDKAHALLVDMGDGHYRVSVRAAYRIKDGADAFCRQFVGGGGRKAAAGINQLPAKDLPRFIEMFHQQF